jgi:glycosyltransferase involved in cell wall biosynthesis
MRILALEPYYGGSHRAFLDGWRSVSRHEWTLLTLPAHHWKWRMRHAAVTFAREAASRLGQGEGWDVLFATDMLDLAALRGLAPRSLAKLPAVLYFHESQLTYPTRNADPRDVHFALTNMTAALAADAAWFNSGFHRDAFCNALGELLSAVPDSHCADAPEAIRRNAAVRHPGIDKDCFDRHGRGDRAVDGPLRIVWAARWEHDKGPQELFDAMRRLRGEGVAYRLAVVGEQFRDAPAAFELAKEELGDRIEVWGHRPTRREYLATLEWADVFVSTARHEFFGLAAVEATACGALAVLPERLAYPEVFAATLARAEGAAIFYGQSPGELAGVLGSLTGRGDWRLPEARAERREWARRYGWARLAGRYDRELEEIAR